jgi:thioredoxin-related protein
VLFDEELNPIDIIPQYHEPEMIGAILQFYSSNSYKSTPWQDFYNKYAAERSKQRLISSGKR